MKILYALKLAPNGRILGHQQVYINAGDVLADVPALPADFGNYIYADGQLQASPAPSTEHRLNEHGEWVMDWRNTPLYLCASGVVYGLGDHFSGATFDGLGDFPAWLTTQAPPSSAHDWDTDAQAWVLNAGRAES